MPNQPKAPTKRKTPTKGKVSAKRKPTTQGKASAKIKARAKKIAPAKTKVARRLGVKIEGITYYPLPAPVHEPGLVAQAILNPCAGQLDGTSCGPGCICKAGQRWYTVGALRELGFTLSN